MVQSNQSDSAINLRPDGRLQNLDDWNVDVCREMAKREGITFTHAHWEIIDLMRQYYASYNLSPIYKLLKKEVAEQLGAEKASDDYLMSLFPKGVLSQATRLAGIPRPIFDAELEHTVKLRSTEPSEQGKQPGEFEFAGKTYQFYAGGNLVHPEEWNEQLAEHLASRESIQMTQAHWEVIRFLRKFYFQYGITPMVRLLMKHMRQQLGDAKSSEAYLYQLFPGGPSRQGSRIAGLPEPQGCIDP